MKEPMTSTPESMVERVADAIAVSLLGKGNKAGSRTRKAARAALTAMLEPLTALLAERQAHYERKAAARDPLEDDNLNRHDLYTFAAEAMEATDTAVSAMIQAALAEPSA